MEQSTFRAAMSDTMARGDPQVFQTRMAAALKQVLADYGQDPSKKLTHGRVGMRRGLTRRCRRAPCKCY